MELIKVYLKKDRPKEVLVYRDRECKEIKAILDGTFMSLPNKRRKTITLNCNNYKVEWL